jgi:serine/threonine-protein kinase RsbW
MRSVRGRRSREWACVLSRPKDARLRLSASECRRCHRPISGYPPCVSSVWRFPAVPDSVRHARHAIREIARDWDASDCIVDAILLCVSEAVTNVVLHAYREGAAGDLELEAREPDGFVCVHVRDTGSGVRPRADSPGAGYGLALISQLASEVIVRSGAADRGTEVIMRFDLTSRNRAA